MRAALLLAAACLALSGCATIKGWFAPDPPPAEAREPVVEAPRATLPPPEPAPRVTPPPAAPVPAPRLTPPGPPRPAPPAPPPAPVAVPPPPPAPVLSPVLSEADEQRLRADTQQRLDSAEKRLRQIDPAKLASAQQESLQTVLSFLDKAREALQAKDIQRAFTLADKASILADELSRQSR